MGIRLFVFALALLVAAAAVHSDTQVRLSGHLALGFAERPSVREVAEAFSDSGRPFLWGPGWEVILDHVSLGGTYLVSFFQDGTPAWWLDWYAEPLYLGYHLFGAGSLIDPFVQIGLGSAGRVILEEQPPVDRDKLYISVFPFVAGGFVLDLDGFVIGSRIAAYPAVSPPPATDFSNYPLDNFQVSLFASVGIGGSRGHGSGHRGRHAW